MSGGLLVLLAASALIVGGVAKRKALTNASYVGILDQCTAVLEARNTASIDDNGTPR